jgi:prefoldin subunit 5
MRQTVSNGADITSLKSEMYRHESLIGDLSYQIGSIRSELNNANNTISEVRNNNVADTSTSLILDNISVVSNDVYQLNNSMNVVNAQIKSLTDSTESLKITSDITKLQLPEFPNVK